MPGCQRGRVGTGAALLVLAGTLLLCLAAPPAPAGEIDDADFGLRLTAAINRFARYTDMAGMGCASAGSRLSSGFNPAGTGWSPPVGENHWGLSFQYSGVLLAEGTKLSLLSESGSVEDEDLGTFQPSVMQLWSNRATTRQGLDFEWDGHYAELQWGRMVSDCTAIGLNVNVLTSVMSFDLGPLRVARSRGETYAARAGALWEASSGLFLGAAVDYSISPSKSKAYDFMGLGVGTTSTRDTLYQVQLRPGISWLATEDLTIDLDYQFAWLKDDTGRLRVHRFYGGFDQTIVEGVYLRGGAVADTEGNWSWTAGVGVAPSESIFIDLAYQRGMFPEIREEFGRSQVLSLSLSLLF